MKCEIFVFCFYHVEVSETVRKRHFDRNTTLLAAIYVMYDKHLMLGFVQECGINKSTWCDVAGSASTLKVVL